MFKSKKDNGTAPKLRALLSFKRGGKNQRSEVEPSQYQSISTTDDQDVNKTSKGDDEVGKVSSSATPTPMEAMTLNNVNQEDNGRQSKNGNGTEKTTASNVNNNNNKDRPMTFQENCNLLCTLFAWACDMCNVTLVVGTAPVVLIDIDGPDSNLASLPLGSFFIGASLVSLWITPWLFVEWGRKAGFLLGALGFGLLGTVLGMFCLPLESTWLLTAACLSYGASMGIGFYLRFAVVEVVPYHWQATAVTLVVSGGLVAAFAGPQSAIAARGFFAEEYMGVFVMTGIFNLLNGLFVSLIQFPPPPPHHHLHDHHGVTIHGHLEEHNENDEENHDDDEFSMTTQDWIAKQEEQRKLLWEILTCRDFIAPMLVSSFAWAAMAMPMAIVRVAMGQLGFSHAESLWVIEFHFVGMYLPGFFTGSLIAHYGPKWEILMGICIYGLALSFDFLAQPKNEHEGNIIFWGLGLFTVGTAWNFCFTSSTIWITSLYRKDPELKPRVQAANEFCMFFISGMCIVSASYIFEMGGNGIAGWHFLNKVLCGVVGLMAVILIWDEVLDLMDEQKEKGRQSLELELEQADNDDNL